MTDDIRTGLRRSAGLAGSTFVLGLTFGALARAHGWGLGAPVVASLAIFSGSAQFALLTVLAGGGAAWTAVASAAKPAVINRMPAMLVSNLVPASAGSLQDQISAQQTAAASLQSQISSDSAEISRTAGARRKQLSRALDRVSEDLGLDDETDA